MAADRPVRITRLLVANRGEIARRVFRTARAMGMTTIAVHSEPDADAAHVADADLAVGLPGSTSAETYLDAAAVLAAASRARADAVHPGYGFLSENADFARRVEAAGLVWVGPPAAAIEAMGDKLTALERVRAAGVPTLPRVEVAGLGSTELAAAAADIGYPLLVKASAGGGGKGMRVVREAFGLTDAVDAARREAARAFGSDVVYLERYLDPARHVEVQVMADATGVVQHYYDRECSVQRRHQKIVEESPSPLLPDEVRQRMYAAAEAAAAAVDYRGAGTVEFVVGPDWSFSFLEMNTRLQVEHPVTEAVTGVDLVRLQLLVAQGHPLPPRPPARGAAVEARVYAEDPARDFLPASGRLLRWDEPSGVRVDSGVRAGDEVSVHYDPMLAKVVAHAPTREEAALRLARALADLRVHGLTTNREYLVRLLRHPAFLAGETYTDFVERHAPDLAAEPEPERVRRSAVGAAVAARERRLAADPGRLPVPPGWRNNRGTGELTTYQTPVGEVTVELTGQRDGTLAGTACGTAYRGRIWAFASPRLDLEVDGLREPVTVVTDGSVTWVQAEDGVEVRLVEQPRFPDPGVEQTRGGLTAPMNGTVVTVTVVPGDRVAAGQALVVVEAMKMEHRVTAPVGGTVGQVLVAPGQSVAAEELLVVLEPDEE